MGHLREKIDRNTGGVGQGLVKHIGNFCDHGPHVLAGHHALVMNKTQTLGRGARHIGFVIGRLIGKAYRKGMDGLITALAHKGGKARRIHAAR